MKHLIFLTFLSLITLQAQSNNKCELTIMAAYDVGNANQGAINQEHAIQICKNSLMVVSLPINDATMRACLMGVSPNPYKNIEGLFSQYCRQ